MGVGEGEEAVGDDEYTLFVAVMGVFHSSSGEITNEVHYK